MRADGRGRRLRTDRQPGDAVAMLGGAASSRSRWSGQTLSRRDQMGDGDLMLLSQAPGDEGAVARLGVALDAEQRGDAA